MTALSSDTLRATARRYRPAGQFARHYVASKLRHDPATAALLALGQAHHFGDVVDLGCGRGQFAAALLQAGLARRIIGVDCHAGHLAQARMAMGDLAFESRQQDFAADQQVPEADTVLLIDVLYQLTTAAQSALLRNAAHAARNRVIIRTADPKRGTRSTVTRLLERSFRTAWPHAGSHVNARLLPDMTAELQQCGFESVVVPCWAGTPFSNVLMIAQRSGRKTAV